MPQGYRCIDIFGYCLSPKHPTSLIIDDPRRRVSYSVTTSCPNDPSTCKRYRTLTQSLKRKRARSRAHTTHDP